MNEQAKVRVTFVAIAVVLCVWLVVMTLWVTAQTEEKPEPKPAITVSPQQAAKKETAKLPAKRVQRTRTKRKLPTRRQTRQEIIEKQFSVWNGSHRGLTKLIKESMNDPKSYQHVETRYGDKGDYLIVVTTFRGKNVFGGVVKNSVTAKVDLNGNVISIISQEP